MDKNEIKTDLMNFMYVKGFRKKNVFNLNFDNKDPEFVKKRNDNFYRATHYNLKALSVYENLIKKVTNGKDILDIANNSNYVNAVVHQAIDNEVLYDEAKLNPDYQLDEYNKQIEDIVNKRNAEEQVRNNPKNSKKNYDNYITLHCGSKMGKTKEEMIDNIAKIEAARRLKKVGVKFDVKEIHKGAARLKERYSLNSLNQMDEKILKSALRDGRSASGFLRIMRKNLYKIEPNNYKAYDSYLKEMKTVLNSMSKQVRYLRQVVFQLEKNAEEKTGRIFYYGEFIKKIIWWN